MIETIAAFDGRIAKVQGPARSGKTQAVIARCVELLKAGVAPESILIEANTHFATHTLRTRLQVAAGDSLADQAKAVKVATPFDICVETLSAPEALKATGRTPRVLVPAEYNFFLEDMKTLGQPIRRLRSMLNFFFTQWANFEPSKAWVLGGEEEAVFQHLVRVLNKRGAMLEQELAYVCGNYLMSDEGRASSGYDYVLCDDFQNLSFAEQTSLCLLAEKQIMVFGNPNETTRNAKKLPSCEGFVNFDVNRKHVDVFTLTTSYGNPTVIRFAESLLDHGDMDASLKSDQITGEESDIISVKWTMPEQEINELTKYMRVVLDKENENLMESRTCVLVPNKRWGRMLERVLKQRGYDVSSAGVCSGIGGDPRDTSRCAALIAYTKLNLIAKPQDMTAWRSWCGLGHALTNSDAWMNLQDYADLNGFSLYEALEKAEGEQEAPFLRAKALTDRFASGKEIIEHHSKRRGYALLAAIGATDLAEFAEIKQSIIGDEDAQTLYELVRTYLFDPLYPAGEHTMHINGYEAMTGTEYDNIFCFGAVDGFVPFRDAFEVISMDEDREAILNAERKRFYSAVSKAKKRLVISGFSKSDLELAERTKMQVVRVKSENGERIALLRPSCFLGETGACCPTTVGGQALMAEHDLN